MWLLDVNLPKKIGALLGEFGIEAHCADDRGWGGQRVQIGLGDSDLLALRGGVPPAVLWLPLLALAWLAPQLTPAAWQRRMRRIEEG